LPAGVFANTPVLLLASVSLSISVHASTSGTAGKPAGSTKGPSNEAFSMGIDALQAGFAGHEHVSIKRITKSKRGLILNAEAVSRE